MQNKHSHFRKRILTEMQFTPQIIPHEKFHIGKWFLSVEEPAWYYFKQGEANSVILNKNFLSSVDPPLRELVAFLHKQEILTTPSCSGHCKSSKSFKKIYSVLEKEKEKINTNGILLYDIETCKKILFREKNYILPWNRRDFVTQVMEQQQGGVLGFHFKGREKIKKKICEINFPGTKTKETNAILLIQTEHWKSWRKITSEIKKIISDS